MYLTDLECHTPIRPHIRCWRRARNSLVKNLRTCVAQCCSERRGFELLKRLVGGNPRAPKVTYHSLLIFGDEDIELNELLTVIISEINAAGRSLI